MSAPISIQPEAVLDPRGDFRRKPATLAPRLNSLTGKKVLLFDNARVTSYVNIFGPMYQWLSQYLEREHKVTCSSISQNLLQRSKDQITKLADEIGNSDIDAVVVALCKGGVTQPSSLFAAELEARGKPVVQICTDIGYPLAAVTASTFAPGLPIVVIELASGDKDNFGKAQVDAIIPEIVAGWTTNPATLLERFRAKFAPGAAVVSKGGKIDLPAITATATEGKGGTTVKVNPGQFARDVYEQFCASQMCDGLPVIPPTEEYVNEMLRFTDLDPDLALIDELPPSGASLTIRSLAVNAVMAGCRPEYFPIVVAAGQAIADPAYRVFQGAISTHPGGNAIVVSGPLAEELGIASGSGCLGPGFRANATIGRALSMTIVNVSRAFPGKSDLSTFGSSAEFTYCFAENDKGNPWQPLHTDLYGPETTSVTVHKCEGPHNALMPRTGDPALLLRVIADTAATLGGNNIVHLGRLLVLLTPYHAELIAKAGWSKQDVKEFLFETARHPADVIQRRESSGFPAHFMKMDQIPVLRSPEEVTVVVCGAKGGFAMVGIPWGLAKAVNRPVVLKDGSPLKTLKGRFA